MPSRRKSQVLRTIAAGHVDPSPSWHMPPHAHHYHEMIVIMRGRMSVNIRNTTVNGAAGDVLFYPANTVHEETSGPDDPAETTFTAFEWPDDTVTSWPLILHDTQGRIRELIQWLLQESNSRPGSATRNLCSCFLRTIIAEWERLMLHRDSVLIDRIHTFIRANVEKPISLDDLAETAGMSKFHFVRRYRTETAHTPMDDVRRIRIQHAKHLILTTGLPLKDIAPRCGLGDVYRLSHLFRRYLDITPRELRTSMRK